MIATIDFAVFVQGCKAAHELRNLPLCTVYVVLLLPSWCCKAQLLTIYLADPCRFDEIFQTKFFSHTTSFYRIWASDACAACLLCSDAVWTAAVKTDQPITVGIFFNIVKNFVRLSVERYIELIWKFRKLSFEKLWISKISNLRISKLL